MPSNQTELCSQCYSLVPKGSRQCPSCGQTIRQSTARPTDRNYSRLGMLQNIGSWGKVLLILAIFTLPAVFFYWAYTYFWREASNTPFPETRSELVEKFFYALQHDMPNDLQGCYELIAGSKGAQSFVVRDSREQYIDHLKRIRNYLIQYVGENFHDKMEIVTNENHYAGAVLFDDFIQLTPVIVSVWTLDEERNNYGMQDILEFPFPHPLRDSLGISARDDMLDRILSDVNPPNQRVEIENYKTTEQLDDRHKLLLYIIETYGHEPEVQRFLAYWIPRNETAVHLVRIAAQWTESAMPVNQ